MTGFPSRPSFGFGSNMFRLSNSMEKINWSRIRENNKMKKPHDNIKKHIFQKYSQHISLFIFKD